MNEQLKQFVLLVFVRVHMLWFLSLQLEALVAKMTTREQKAKTGSVIRVQRAFHIKFHYNPPSENIRRWYHQFEDTGCLCKGKSSGWPCINWRTCRTVRRASRELAIPVMSVWRFLWMTACFAWPPRSPDLMPCNFYLLGFVKYRVYVPLLLADLNDIWHRIEAAVVSVTPDTLSKVWDELCYRLDVCHVTKGAHIEHL